MENNTPLISASGAPTAAQMSAGYIRALSDDGRSFEAARKASGLSLEEFKFLCRAKGIGFSDYNPDETKIRLEWRKEKPGWALYKKGSKKPLGDCYRDTKSRYYKATAFDFSVRQSNGRGAIKALCKKIDARSIGLFEIDDVDFYIQTADRKFDRVYP